MCLAAPGATAQAPLAGKGENIQPIARVPIFHPNEVELAGDWAFVSNDQKGMVIVNIADPQHPFIESTWDCEAGWADMDISPDANIAVLTNAHSGECFEDQTAVVLLDISDKKHPKVAGRIPYDPEISYVHTATMDMRHNLLYLNPQAAAFYPQTPAHIPYYDISNPANPVRKGFIEGRGVGLAHDTYIDHRPDGRSLMYAASIHQSDVFDLTDPFKPALLQQTASPEITISHDVQPNHKRDMIIVDDEGAAGGQLDEAVSACGRVGGPGPAAVDSGSVHFYAASPDGTFANGGAVELGSWNAPANANTGACVAHVFWQAPDENRLTQAYYRTGAFVLDFEDPANVKMLGSFVAEGGSNYWSAKPHRGYLFATDQEHGLDILRYTGEGGKRWPATAGPAEIQRAARNGVPYVPVKVPGGTAEKPLPSAGPVDTRAIGRVRFTAKLKKVPGRKGRKTALTIVFTDAKGKNAGSAKFKRPAGKAGKATIYGGAVAGTYKWTVKAGRKVLGRGKVRVVKASGMAIPPNRTVAVGVR
jgi:hypothetical protein